MPRTRHFEFDDMPHHDQNDAFDLIAWQEEYDQRFEQRAAVDEEDGNPFRAIPLVLLVGLIFWTLVAGTVIWVIVPRFTG